MYIDLLFCLSMFILHSSIYVDEQALLDVYTIQKEIGKLDGIKVGLVGDLANGRTVRSLAYLLAKFNDVKIYFVSPEVVKMKVMTPHSHLQIHTIYTRMS